MSDLLADVDLASLVRDLSTGRRDPREHLEQVRERFLEIDPSIHAFVDERGRWDRLDREMSALSARFPDRDLWPPLYGTPVGIKDIFHVDGLETRAGSDVPPGELSGPEGTALKRLRDARAVVLGKTVTAEFAYFAPGPTRNPNDTAHTPGGSSSGSAAAVAAGMCPLALGTQTIGSISRPAAFCGIVGVKPSYGRIPTDGVLPAAPSADHVGYFTQDVDGARLAAGVLCDDWRAGDEPPPLGTIGVVDGPYLSQASPVGREQFESHVDRLSAAGFDVRRLELFPDIDAVNDRHESLVAAEMALSHSDLYPDYGDRYADETGRLIEDGMETSVGDLCEARTSRDELRREVHVRMDEHAVDLVVSPSAPGPAPEGIASTGDPIMNLPWTHAGLPTVTVPASVTDEGLPLGIQCAARFGDDEWLLPWAEDVRSVFS